MAVTQNSYTGNGSTTVYNYTFPYLKQSEVKATLDGVATTAFTHPSATSIQFNTAPGSGVKIKILRETDTDNLAATFYAGSAIKSQDLNDNFTQNLYTTQEVNARYVSNLGGTMTGDLNLGEDVVIKFEGATDNAHETTLTVADPTADRTITLPNVTGTVVTTGDTGTVATGMIAADAINGTKIADDSINSEHYVDGSIDTAHIADLQVTTDKLASNAVTTIKILDANVTTAKIANDAVDATKLANTSVSAGTYTAADITVDAQGRLTAAASGTIAGSEIAADAIDGTKIADNAINSEHYTDGSIDREHLAADIIDGSKIADDSLNSEHYVDGSIDTAHIANNAITASQLASDCIDQSKIADNAVLAEHISDANITVDKLATNSVQTAKIADGNVTTAKLAADAIDATKIADNAVTTDHIQDAELTTLAGMQSGTASILADSTALTSTTTELNQLDGKTLGETTLTTNSDTAIPTSKAVNDRILTVTNALGGFVAIANETSFPATHPDPSDGAGTVVSVSDAGGVVVNGSGVASITNGAGSGNTVTINGFPSSLYSKTLAAGVGLQVQTTTTLHTYDYHKILAKEADVEQLSGDINDFNERYRVAGSAPGSNNDAGDLYFDTSANKMKVYNATTSAWDDVASVGNFFINTISSSSGTGGGSATFNGSAYRFTLSNAPTMAQQLIVSVNGVIQKPNAGSSQPSEGFAISGNDIIFSAAPASGADYFIVTQGSSVSIGTPSDNTVSTAKIQNLAVNNSKIADDTITEGKLDIHNAPSGTDKFLKYTSNGMEWAVPTDTNTQVGGSTAVDFDDNVKARFGTGNDLEIFHDGSNSYIKDVGTGILQLNTNYLQVKNGDDDETIFTASQNGPVSLFHDNSKKLETTSSGINVTGQINVNGSELSAAPVITANADGSISANDAVLIQSDGTVKKIEVTTTTEDYTYGTQTYLNDGDAENISIAADPHNANRWVICFTDDEGTKNVYIKVITRSGTSITQSSWYTLPSSNGSSHVRAVWDVGTANRILQFYYRSSGWRVKLVTFTGSAGSESFSAGSETQIMNHVPQHYHGMVRLPQAVGTSGNYVTIYSNSGNTKARFVNLSGTTFTDMDTNPNLLTFSNSADSAAYSVNPFNSAKGMLAYRSGDDSKLYVRPLTFSGTGTDMTVSPGTVELMTSYTISTDNQMVNLVYIDEDHFVVTAKGRDNSSYNQISFLVKYDGSTYTKSSVVNLPTNLTGTPGSENQLYRAELSNNTTTDQYKLIWTGQWTGSGTTSGMSYKLVGCVGTVDVDNFTLSWANQGRVDADTSNESDQGYTTMAQQSGQDQPVLMGWRSLSTTSSLDKRVKVRMFRSGSESTNLSTSFIGFSSAAYTNGQSAKINVIGNTTTKSSLTPGTDYYVSKTGALATTAGVPSVKAGIAISSTKLLIK